MVKAFKHCCHPLRKSQYSINVLVRNSKLGNYKFRCILYIIASHDSSEDYTIISIKKADFIGNAWLHIHNSKGFYYSAN